MLEAMSFVGAITPAGWASLAALIVWIGLLAGRGGFWRADQKLDMTAVRRVEAGPVVAVVPARDEVHTIGITVRSLLRQDYPGPLSVVVVDDDSRDGTADAARAAAEKANASDRLHVLQGKPLPEGWSGKLWAVHQGVTHARAVVEPKAAFLLLTDADIEHNPGNLSRLMAVALHDDRALVSLMVRLRCVSGWEKLLIPAFVFFFQKLYPFPWVNQPGKRTAGAAGGCMLVRTDALDAVGGIEAIKGALIDDCTLAQRIKGTGRSIWLGIATRTRSLRRYQAVGEVWRMVVRTAFTQLRHSVLALVLMLAFMTLAYLWPPFAVAWGLTVGDWVAAALALAAWLLMAVAYWPTLKVYHMPRWRALSLPVAALLYALMTLDSARRHWFGRGRPWKGRVYS
ncbi:glycosyltransferase [Roseospira visakhapatnamensis]|uniref:Hopene-associated glycosyltransferase HpnB n=1 Tax=Roseospira visakhapatnamensis TaxID=390880 RepID=A0A7W6RB62_9PROT|nr:glycosyltransferase [Roseospira visakhapatnamensis]MBB4265122.1 hopene-associated glycosyltransferase HpnB [Roseospira visakhapatnamensis]